MYTYSQDLCYTFMIVAMMVNAGLVTLFYPFTVFGFAMIEENFPSKKCWYVILIYTMSLTFVMFMWQLEFWDAIFDEHQRENVQAIIGSMHLGIERLPSGDFAKIFGYFLPEILLLFTLTAHLQKEKLGGILDLKECQIETVKEAIHRYLQNAELKKEVKKSIEAK
mmetsp:Transcript_4980/g.3603  ORF Transcript_4980/g.3603 Transcript_4980/m.3603 type:complete len:166 (+) Transcript_4980:1009-1506(+)